LPLLLLFAPFFANLFTLVIALFAPNTSPFITSIAAKLVVADTVIDPLKGNIRRLMTLVLTVETWKRCLEIIVAMSRAMGDV
jgi:hypothetical protein